MREDGHQVLEQCQSCGKTISEDEYVVNWGWCAECFGNDYEAYLAEQAKATDA